MPATDHPTPTCDHAECLWPGECRDYTTAKPAPGSVRDAWGDPCRRALPDSYPLRARCLECGARVEAEAGGPPSAASSTTSTADPSTGAPPPTTPETPSNAGS